MFIVSGSFTLELFSVSIKNNLSAFETSIYEVIRERLELDKAEFAALLGQTRQWYHKRSTYGSRYTIEELRALFDIAQMTKTQFLDALLASR